MFSWPFCMRLIPLVKSTSSEHWSLIYNWNTWKCDQILCSLNSNNSVCDKFCFHVDLVSIEEEKAFFIHWCYTISNSSPQLTKSNLEDMMPMIIFLIIDNMGYGNNLLRLQEPLIICNSDVQFEVASRFYQFLSRIP